MSRCLPIVYYSESIFKKMYGCVWGTRKGLWYFLLHLCARILLQTIVTEILIHALIMLRIFWNDFITLYLALEIFSAKEQVNKLMVLSSYRFLYSKGIKTFPPKIRVSLVNALLYLRICFSKCYFFSKREVMHIQGERAGFSNNVQSSI